MTQTTTKKIALHPMAVKPNGFKCLNPAKAPRRCATVQPGAIHTMKQAGHHPESVVFSRPKFTATGLPVAHGYGAGSAYPRGRQHGLFHVDIPSPTTLWPIQSFGGFSVQQGTKP